MAYNTVKPLRKLVRSESAGLAPLEKPPYVCSANETYKD